jgi:hypothetical protein
VHVYSYPYEDLEIGDLMGPLRDVVDGLRGERREEVEWSGGGFFRIVMMGQQISFFSSLGRWLRFELLSWLLMCACLSYS